MRGREEKQIKSVVSHKDWGTEKEHKGRNIHFNNKKKQRKFALFSIIYQSDDGGLAIRQTTLSIRKVVLISITAAVDELDTIIL